MSDTRVFAQVVPTEYGWVGLAVSAVGVQALLLPLPTADEAWAQLRKTCSATATATDAADAGATAGPATTAAVALRDRLAAEITAYYAGEPVALSDYPLDLSGTPFIAAVRATVAAIPRGEVRSYGDVAAAVGHPGAARAVGQVMAKNRVTVLIPCHRVVGSSRQLTGFGGGLPMKERMLQMEGIGFTAGGQVVPG